MGWNLSGAKWGGELKAGLVDTLAKGFCFLSRTLASSRPQEGSWCLVWLARILTRGKRWRGQKYAPRVGSTFRAMSTSMEIVWALCLGQRSCILKRADEEAGCLSGASFLSIEGWGGG